jgi:hypothetical protein
MDAPAPYCQGPGDACLTRVCDCNGHTAGDGCGWASFPFASFGPCPDANEGGGPPCPSYARSFDPQKPVPGTIAITAISFDNAGTAPCGALLAKVTFTFTARDADAHPEVATNQHNMMFANVPLTRACAERLHLAVGDLQPNAELTRVGDALTCEMFFENFTADPAAYGNCYKDYICMGPDGG